MQLSLTDNLFRNVKAGGVWLLALLSKTGMEKRARDDAMARELQLHGLTAIQRPACSTAKNPGSCSIEVKTIFR
jgi:hypothetical protein